MSWHDFIIWQIKQIYTHSWYPKSGDYLKREEHGRKNYELEESSKKRKHFVESRAQYYKLTLSFSN